MRPAPPTSSASWRSAPPAARWARSAWRRSPRTSARSPRRLRRGLAAVPGLEQLAIWTGDDVDRVGVASFVLRGYRHPLLAAILSAEHAIGVRHGCFCAHPLITRLLGIPDGEVRRLRAELRAGGAPPLPGAVRASLGLGTTAADVDLLTGALEDIARNGPALRYEHLAGHDEYEPVMNGRLRRLGAEPAALAELGVATAPDPDRASRGRSSACAGPGSAPARSRGTRGVRDARRHLQPRAGPRAELAVADRERQLALEHVERLDVAAVEVRRRRGAAGVAPRLRDPDLLDVREQRHARRSPAARRRR